MADNTEELGIRIRTDGVVETTSRIQLVGAEVDKLGNKLDSAGKGTKAFDDGTRKASLGAQALSGATRHLFSELTGGLEVPGAVGNALHGMGEKGAASVGRLATVVPALGLVFGGLAAVATLTAVAYNIGSREADAYAKALILTGNAAGTTSGFMSDMARRIDSVVGTQAQASLALTALAATGQVAARDMNKLGETSVRMTRVLGEGAEANAKVFADLGRAPLEASIKLNANTNYLTASVYEQIRALQEQGRTSEAASVAQNAYADAMNQRLPQIEARLGLLQRSWRGVKDAAGEAWDFMLGLGREKTLDEQLTSIDARLQALRTRRANNPAQTAQREEAILGQRSATNRSLLNTAERASGDAAAALATKEYIAAREANDRWTDAALTNREKLNKALAAYKANNDTITRGGGTLDPVQVAREEAAIRKQFADKPGAATDPYKALNHEVAQRLRLAQAELDNGAKLSQADQFRAETLGKLTELEKQRAAPDGLRAGVEQAARAIEQAEAQRKAAADAAEVQQRFVQDRANATRAAQNEVEALAKARDTLASETLEIGMNSRAIHERRQAVEAGAIADKEADLARIDGLPAYMEEATALREQIRLRREMMGLKNQKFAKAQEQLEVEDNKRRSESLARSIEDGLMNGFRDGRNIGDIFFRELKAQAFRTVLRIPIQMFADNATSVTNLLMRGIGTFFGLGGGGGGGFGTGNAFGNMDLGQFFHGGGVAGGEPSFTRAMPAGTWAGVRRFHGGGLANDEIPAVLKRKEGVFTEDQMRALAPVDKIAKAAGPVVHLNVTNVIDSRTDRAEVVALVDRSMRGAQAQLLDMMQRGQV